MSTSQQRPKFRICATLTVSLTLAGGIGFHVGSLGFVHGSWLAKQCNQFLVLKQYFPWDSLDCFFEYPCSLQQPIFQDYASMISHNSAVLFKFLLRNCNWKYFLLGLNYMFTVFPPKWNTDTVCDIGLVCFPGPLCPIVVYFCQSTLTLTTLCCQDILWRHATCMRWKGYSSL